MTQQTLPVRCLYRARARARARARNGIGEKSAEGALTSVRVCVRPEILRTKSGQGQGHGHGHDEELLIDRTWRFGGLPEAVPSERGCLRGFVQGVVWSLIIFVGPVPTLPAQTAEQLLQEAFYLENTAIDPQGAIAKYRSVLDAADLEPATAARARLRLGVCYHLLGRNQKAREELERVMADYPAETDSVKVARRLLGQTVVEDPARYLPPDALLFVEFVDPAKHTHKLLELLEDTPFQNPVDVYTSYLEQRATIGSRDSESTGSGQPAPPGPEAPQRHQLSAVLNEGILRELGNIQGAALCYPSADLGADEFIFVLFPGRSHIVRGALQFLLAARSRFVATMEGFPVFETPAQDGGAGLYTAFSDDVVLISNRERSVRESIERSLRRSASLADNHDFQATLSARAGSFIFSYVSSRSLLRVLERGDRDREAFEVLAMALGIDRLRASSVTLSAGADDSLALSLRLDWAGAPPEAWEIFRTLRPRWDILSAVPRESLGFLSFGLDRGAERWTALRALLHGFAGQLPQAAGAEVERQLERLGSAVAGDNTREFLSALSQVVVGLVPTPARQLWPSFFLVLRFDEPESGPRRFEAALGDLAYLVFANEASRQFRTESMSDGETELSVRVLEPAPLMTIQAVDLGDRLIVATSRQALELVLHERHAARTSVVTVPEEASKALFLRPAAIARQVKALRGLGEGDGLSDVPTVLAEEIPSALLYSREERGRLLFTLTIPEFRLTAGAILNRLGAR